MVSAYRAIVMADLGGLRTPAMDALARCGTVGLVRDGTRVRVTLPAGTPPVATRQP